MVALTDAPMSWKDVAVLARTSAAHRHSVVNAKREQFVQPPQAAQCPRDSTARVRVVSVRACSRKRLQALRPRHQKFVRTLPKEA